MIEATTTPRHHHVQENDDDELDDEENNMNGEHSTDLRDNDDEINDPVCFDDFFFCSNIKSLLFIRYINEITIYITQNIKSILSAALTIIFCIGKSMIHRERSYVCRHIQVNPFV